MPNIFISLLRLGLYGTREIGEKEVPTKKFEIHGEGGS